MCRYLLPLALLGLAARATADVDLYFDPPSQCSEPNAIVLIDLVAHGDGPLPESALTFDVILVWDHMHLELLGTDQSNADHPWFAAGFPNNQDDLNEGVVIPFVDVPDNDGDAIFVALAGPTDPAEIPAVSAAEGLVITTLRFRVLDFTPSAEVGMLESFGTFSVTRVLSAGLPAMDITGDISAVGNVGVPNEDCPGDLSGNRQVNLQDLAIILVNFGMTNASFSDGDLDCDGDVDLVDLATLLSVFGVVCP